MCSTSMPLEPGFRGVICASFGSTDDTAGYDTGARPRHDLCFTTADPESLSELKSALERSYIGVRLVLAGPPADVHAAAAAAAERGMLEEEMTLLYRDDGPRVVFCGHCRAATTFQSGDTEVGCQGCGTILAITDHFSRRLGGYLGFSAHAEEAS